jgi:RNA polymerase sigma-70 factor (ECF subfamily)
MSELLEQTYRTLRKDLKSFIYKRVNDEQLAEDILHDVFLKAHANIDKLKDFSKLNSWIYQITRNSITDYYRAKKPVTEINGYDIRDDIEEKTAMKKLEPTVRTFLKDLPPIYREALVLTDFKGMSQKSLAERLNLSVSAVKSRVQRARKMLKDLFLECCHFEFDKFGSVIDYHPVCCQKCACAE